MRQETCKISSSGTNTSWQIQTQLINAAFADVPGSVEIKENDKGLKKVLLTHASGTTVEVELELTNNYAFCKARDSLFLLYPHSFFDTSKIIFNKDFCSTTEIQKSEAPVSQQVLLTGRFYCVNGIELQSGTQSVLAKQLT